MKRNKTVLFFLNNFNDVDHMAPLIHRLLQENERVVVICFKNYSIREDPRIKAFKASWPTALTIISVALRGSGFYGLVNRLINRVIFQKWVVAFLLQKWGVKCCVSTWCDPLSKGAQTRFIRTAMSKKIRNYCFPHGHNIFLNHDVNTFLKEYFQEHGKGPDFSNRDLFDLYVVQTEHHRSMNIAQGMAPEKLKAWGCMRFTPEWIRFHRKLFPEFSGKKSWGAEMLKVVFFLPHWHYNVNVELVYRLLLAIGDNSKIALVIKGHSRGDQVSGQATKILSGNDNVILNSPAASCSLSAWSDVVINFGSSIGLEALVMDKVVINPEFLHENDTVFDRNSEVHTTHSVEETIQLLDRLIIDGVQQEDRKQSQFLIDQEVFVNNREMHPITRYRESIP